MTTSNYKELLAKRAELEAQINTARQEESGAALATIHSLIAEYGLSQSEVFPPLKRSSSVNKGTTVAPKYRDPATGATWSGRGKAPLWIANKDRAQFAIG